ncbi:MAG: S8 family peptidase [Oscillatoriaceae cyanobacterium]
MTDYEHLELPKANIQLPKRPRTGGFGRQQRSDRAAHGQELLNQAMALSEPPTKEYHPFGINPKLIFKIKVVKNDYDLENHLPELDLHLLAKEPKKKQAIVVFADDDRLASFQQHLRSYSNPTGVTPAYGYLDGIEALVPLQPEDRIGPLLQLEPLTPNELVPLDVELWHTGNPKQMQEYINELDDFLRQIEPDSPMRVTDRYIGDYICIVRVKVRQDILEILLQEDQIKEIDRRPKPAFESPAEFSRPLDDFPEVISPADDASGILVIDSGVQRGHPFLGPALGDAEVFPDPKHAIITGGPDDGDIKTGGHGTGVAGIAIYGDVAECLKNQSFQPPVWLFSARVTDENNEYDPDLLLENQLETAIDYFVRNYPNCQVINISLGDSRLIYQDGQKQFRLAAKIDEIAYNLQHKNLLFVISAGNFIYDAEAELLHGDYPNYLLSESARIIEPATAAIALTVGSLSMGTGSLQYPEDARRHPIAKMRGYPSPFTRTGLSVDGMIKPELVDFGGDYILDGRRVIDNEWGAAVITLNKNYQGASLFKAYIGTSFAAPRVANLAAQLFTKFPKATPNLIRALIADSAIVPVAMPDEIAGDYEKQLKIYGYGQPNFQLAAYSQENRVLLLADNEEISVGNFLIYEIPPLPPNFLTTKGRKTLAITLAFDPPTRHTRGDSYLGVTMEFHLYRNVDRESLVKAYQDASKLEDNGEEAETLAELKQQFGSSIAVDLIPKVNIRKKGTLQKGTIDIKGTKWKYNGKPMYLVVICSRKWAKPGDVDSQRYALIASISHENPAIDIYNQIRLKTRAVQRLRIQG